MISYDEAKGIVIGWDPILGLFTLENLLEVIDIVIQDQNKFEKVIYDLLKNLHCEQETINTVFNLSSINLLKFYCDMIKDLI